jgi:hypothetical protein
MHKRRAGLSLLEVAIASILLVVIFGVTFALLMSSSEHAAAEEAQVQLEYRAREVINQIAADLRQTTWDKVTVGGGGVALTPVKPSAGALLIEGPSEPDPLPPPPTGSRYYQYPDLTRSSVAPPVGLAAGKNLTYNPTYTKWMQFPYTDIQFRMLGVDNAGWTIATYKSAPNSYWTRRVRYQLAMDIGEDGGSPPHPDGIDNNNNELIDESIIIKTEDTLDAAGAVVRTSTTTICRDVVANGFQIYMPAWGTDANKVVVTLTLEKRDRKYSKFADQKITKQVKTSVSLRN